MKILYTTDIHAGARHLFSMLSAAEEQAVDSVVIGGDLIPHYLPDSRSLGILNAQANYLRNVFIPAISDFKRKRDVRIYLDLANDDFICNREILAVHDGTLFNLLHMRKHRFTDSLDIVGYMNVPPTPFGRKDWEKPDTVSQPFAPGNEVIFSGYISDAKTLKETKLDPTSSDTIERDLERLSQMVKRPFVFVSHSPPYNTPLDVLYNGLHAGSLGIRRFIEKWSAENMLVASLHGHIHESPDRSGDYLIKFGKSLCINPGQGNGDGAAFRCVILRLADDDVFPGIEVLRVST